MDTNITFRIDADVKAKMAAEHRCGDFCWSVLFEFDR